MFHDRYGWCQAAKTDALVLSRLLSDYRDKLQRLADELQKAIEIKDTRGFTIAFTKALPLFAQLPEVPSVMDGVGNYLRGCLEQTMADCTEEGMRLVWDDRGLKFYDAT
jgi:hypothetical protein